MVGEKASYGAAVHRTHRLREVVCEYCGKHFETVKYYGPYMCETCEYTHCVRCGAERPYSPPFPYPWGLCKECRVEDKQEGLISKEGSVIIKSDKEVSYMAPRTRDILVVEREIKHTYSDEQDRETVRWRDCLEAVLEKLKQGSALTRNDKANIMLCEENYKDGVSYMAASRKFVPTFGPGEAVSYHIPPVDDDSAWSFDRANDMDFGDRKFWQLYGGIIGKSGTAFTFQPVEGRDVNLYCICGDPKCSEEGTAANSKHGQKCSRDPKWECYLVAIPISKGIKNKMERVHDALPEDTEVQIQSKKGLEPGIHEDYKIGGKQHDYVIVTSMMKPLLDKEVSYMAEDNARAHGDNPNIRGEPDSSRYNRSEPWEVRYMKKKYGKGKAYAADSARDFGDNPNIRGEPDSSRYNRNEPWEVRYMKKKYGKGKAAYAAHMPAPGHSGVGRLGIVVGAVMMVAPFIYMLLNARKTSATPAPAAANPTVQTPEQSAENPNAQLGPTETPTEAPGGYADVQTIWAAPKRRV